MRARASCLVGVVSALLAPFAASAQGSAGELNSAPACQLAFADQFIEGAEGGALVLKPVYQPGVDTREDRGADFLLGRINSRGRVDERGGAVRGRWAPHLPSDGCDGGRLRGMAL